MAFQTGVAVDLIVKRESSFGVAPDQTGGQIIRRTGSSLNLAKEAYQPEEVRGDYQIQDVRHGSRKVQGDIEGELSLATYDSFIEATCRGTWTAGAGFTADAASGVTASAGARTFTRAGGSWLTDGFKTGDVVRWSGLSAGNDGRNLRVVGLTATVMTVAEAVEAVAVADTDCSCAVAGRKVLTGTETRSFTIEQVLREAGFSQLFSGCRIGSMKLSLSPNGVAKISFGVVGKDMALLEGVASPYFAAPDAATTTGVMAGVDGVLRLGGKDLGIVTQLEMSIDLGMTAQVVIGSNTAAEVLPGRTKVTGSMSCFVENSDLLKGYIDEDELALHMVINAPGGTGDFFALHIPRLKFTSGSLKGQGEQTLPVDLQFQAMLKADGGAGTSFDKTTIAFQISN